MANKTPRQMVIANIVQRARDDDALRSILTDHGIDPDQQGPALSSDIDTLGQKDYLDLVDDVTMLDQSSSQNLRKNDVLAEVNLIATRKWVDGMRDMVPAAQAGMKKNAPQVKAAIRSGDREAFTQRMAVMRRETEDLTKKTAELRESISAAISDRIARERFLFDQQERQNLAKAVSDDLRNAPALVTYLSLPDQLDEEMIRAEAQREHDAEASKTARSEHGAALNPSR